MDKKKMIEIRNLLYKATLIGFIFMFIGMVFYWCFPGYIIWVWTRILGTPIAPVLPVMAFFAFAIFKLLIVSFFLIPALAIHWQYCKTNK